MGKLKFKIEGEVEKQEAREFFLCVIFALFFDENFIFKSLQNYYGELGIITSINVRQSSKTNLQIRISGSRGMKLIYLIRIKIIICFILNEK